MMNEHNPNFPFYIRGQFMGGIEDIPPGAPNRLLALARFDHPELKRYTSEVTEERANYHAQCTINNSCAGLAHEYRMTGEALRAAIRGASLTRHQALCLNWTLSGLRAWQTHDLWGRWRLSIYELARMVETTFDGEHTLAAWLNLWGDNPGRPMPQKDGLTRFERGAAARIRNRSESHQVNKPVPIPAHSGESDQ